MRPRATVLLVIFTVLVTGCIGPFDTPDTDTDTPEENDTDTGTDRAGVMHDLQVMESQLFTGQSTLVELRLRNHEDDALTNVETILGNTGRLSIQRKIPDAQRRSQAHRCHYETIPADSGKYRCVWKVSAPQTLQDIQTTVTLPITAYTTYTQALPPNDAALDIAFKPDHAITPEQDTAAITLQDEAVTATFEAATPVSAGERTVPLTVSIQNTGNGAINGPVHIQFGGTLSNADWAADTTCVSSTDTRTMRLSPEDGVVNQSCTIALTDTDLAGKTFFLRPSVTYRYMIADESPITVTARQ